MTKEEALLHPDGPVAFHTQTALLHRHTKEYYPQAIVFIIMGELARESLVEDALASVRLLGRWDEAIIVLTDRPSCFSSTNMELTVISVPSKASLIEIKAIKAEVFSYLPLAVERVLYMDVDILVRRNLGFFLQDLSHLLYFKFPQLRSNTSSAVTSTSSGAGADAFSMAAFLDAKGHYVGFCSGCEKWHSGVLYLARGYGSGCLSAWAATLRSGRFNTDQESLDYVEAAGNCSNIVAIPSRHLLFAKDYIAMVLTSDQTFTHLTAANRKGEKDYFYKEIIIPRIRNSLHPPLKPFTESTQKQC